MLDIGATRNHREPDFELLKDIASEAFMPLSCGGGITNLDQIHELLAIGYEKVVINSELIRHPELITNAAEAFGSQSIVASIDAKKTKNGYQCVINDGHELTEKNRLNWQKRQNDWVPEKLLLTRLIRMARCRDMI